jgi:hypothetical protein
MIAPNDWSKFLGHDAGRHNPDRDWQSDELKICSWEFSKGDRCTETEL